MYRKINENFYESLETGGKDIVQKNIHIVSITEIRSIQYNVFILFFSYFNL